MFTESFRVRYADLGPDAYVRPTAILEYLQEIATDHSGEVGYDLYRMRSEYMGWAILCWDVRLGRPIRWAEKLTARTWPYSFSGAIGKRRLELWSENEELLVQADSWWALIDLRTHQTRNIPPEMKEAFRTDGEAPFHLRRPRGKASEQLGEYPVREMDFDTNGHVNNIRFAEMAFSALPPAEPGKISEFMVEYKRQGMRGDRIMPARSLEKGGAYVELANPEGLVFVKLQVLQETQS